MTAAVSQTTLRVDVASTKAGSKEEDVTNEFRALEQLAADLATRMQALSVSRGQLKGLASETAAVGTSSGIDRRTQPSISDRKAPLSASHVNGSPLRPSQAPGYDQALSEQSMGMTSGIRAKRDEPYDSTRKE